MATPRWQVSGDYFEACSCDSVCPCPTTGLAGRPTQGHCNAALFFRVERGQYGPTRLEGRRFAVLLHTPGPMIEGGWTVGLVVDDGAGAEQRDALAAIASGQAGGPMAVVGPLVGTFAGVESRPIRMEGSGLARTGTIPGLVDLAIAGIPGANEREPIFFDNVGHPAASRLALARATRSHLHAFGIDWDDDSGRNNGHFAPFAWSGGES